MTLLVGFAPGKDDEAPLQLAALFARSEGDDLHLHTVVPAWWPTPIMGGADKEYAEWSRAQGDEAVAEAKALAAELCPDVRVEASWGAGKSASSGLLEKAKELDARLVVVGSGRGGGYGHVHVSSTADVLLHASEIPVALAPRGYSAVPDATVTRVTCAIRGDETSRRALESTAEITERIGAKLRVATFAVRGKTMYPTEIGPGAEDMVMAAWSEQAERMHDEALAELPAVQSRDVETVIAQGRNWQAALDKLEWERDEVLVVGSARAGLATRLFLGSNATKIVRAAPVPVVVVP